MELKGGRQPGLELYDHAKNDPAKTNLSGEDTNFSGFILRKRDVRPARIFAVSDSESAAHKDLIEMMDNAIWLR